jgi:hypothetical protein
MRERRSERGLWFCPSFESKITLVPTEVRDARHRRAGQRTAAFVWTATFGFCQNKNYRRKCRVRDNRRGRNREGHRFNCASIGESQSGRFYDAGRRRLFGASYARVCSSPLRTRPAPDRNGNSRCAIANHEMVSRRFLELWTLLRARAHGPAGHRIDLPHARTRREGNWGRVDRARRGICQEPQRHDPLSFRHLALHHET